jgi:hypothetical protein
MHLLAPMVAAPSGTVATPTNVYSFSYVNNPADGTGSRGIGTFNIYPLDYARGSTTCSAYVQTPLNNCVQQGQHEVVTAFWSNGQFNWFTRNGSGSTVPTTDGLLTWPAGSVVEDGPPIPLYGPTYSLSNHFSSINAAPPTGNIANYCEDVNQMICGTVIMGPLNGYHNILGTAGSSPLLTMADGWTGLINAPLEAVGRSYVKVQGSANISNFNLSSGGSQVSEPRIDVTPNPMASQPTGPLIVFAQDYLGDHATGTYIDPAKGIEMGAAEGPTGTGTSNFEYGFGLLRSPANDPYMGNNPGLGVARGWYWVDGACIYDGPISIAGAPIHAHIRFCSSGGPAITGSAVKFTVDQWSDTSQVWTSLLACNPTSSAAIGGTCTFASTTGVKMANLVLSPAGATSIGSYLQTASVTPAAVAAGACADQSFVLTGITTTDTVIGLVAPAALGNVSMTATRQSSANNLGIHFCNPSAASVTPPAGVYTAIVAH